MDLRYSPAMPNPTADCPTLVVFCRRPAPGVGKQRLAATLGRAPAREVAALLLDVALEDAAAWPGPVVLAPDRAGDAGWACGLLQRACDVEPQVAGNLGERLAHVDARLRTLGHAGVVFIGSDAPLLDEAYYARAREALRNADVVLGPAEDGGVTLMGARQPWPALADLPWSTAQLGTALAARCRDAGLSVVHLPSRYDVDEATILPRLRADLGDMGTDLSPARRALQAWLERQAREPLRAPA
jgi:rSAM/selenodomain-associated transferase 1